MIPCGKLGPSTAPRLMFSELMFRWCNAFALLPQIAARRAILCSSRGSLFVFCCILPCPLLPAAIARRRWLREFLKPGLYQSGCSVWTVSDHFGSCLVGPFVGGPWRASLTHVDTFRRPQLVFVAVKGTSCFLISVGARRWC